MDKKVKDLHEKITDVYNTMWVAYKKYLEDQIRRSSPQRLCQLR